MKPKTVIDLKELPTAKVATYVRVSPWAYKMLRQIVHNYYFVKRLKRDYTLHTTV